MTASRLRTELTDEEFLYWAAYYELKREREKKEIDAMKRKSRYS